MSDSKPLITFALFTYNQEKFVAEAIRGALSQTYIPLEIIVSDDCSTDSTFDVIQKELIDYSGPHLIKINRNERNSGFGAHINKVMGLASGRLVVAAAGDDISLPERVTKTYAAYEASGGKALSIYFNGHVVNESGAMERLFYPQPPNLRRHELSQVIISGFGILGAAHAWDRRVFDVFGPLPENIRNEDWAIPFRSALLGEITYVDEPMVHYRHHGANAYLGTFTSTANKAEWYKSLLRWAEQENAILESWMQDLTTAERLHPERQTELQGLKEGVKASLRQVRVRKQLLNGASFFHKCKLAAMLASQGRPWRYVVRWWATVFFPHLYLWYVRRNAAQLRKEAEQC